MDFKSFAPESVRIISEAIGISSTTDDACKYLAEDITFRLQGVVQEAFKFTSHSKRRKLTTSDVDHSLRVKDYEPVYGFSTSEYQPFRGASGGGREIYFNEDKEIDLDELTTKPLPKVPHETSIKTHWLAIEGVQPAIPENPPSCSKEVQKSEAVNPASKMRAGEPSKERTLVKSHVKIKPLGEHDLSVEQQLYYKEITEACISHDEAQRTAALTSLSKDPGLHKMVPRLVCFIAEGVKLNTLQTNLAILIYLMRMIKCLMDNSSLYLEKYLHQLLPAMCTCAVSKQLCAKPESDNHWALREFAAKLLVNVCERFNTSTNNIQSRIVKVLSQSLANARAPLATLYGCIFALNHLDHGAVQQFVLPIIRPTGDRIRLILDSSVSSSSDKVAAQYLRNVIVKTSVPVLKVVKRPPDAIEQYRTEYGALGQVIYENVVRSRQGQTTQMSLLPRGANFSSNLRSAQPGKTTTTTTIIGKSAQIARSISTQGGTRPNTSVQIRMQNAGIGTLGQSIVRTPTTPGTPTGSKFIIVNSAQTSSHSQSPGGSSLIGGSGPKFLTAVGQTTPTVPTTTS